MDMPINISGNLERKTEQFPVFVGLFGYFQLLKLGELVLQRGHKTEQLLSILALRLKQPTTRAMLLQTIWPEYDIELAGQSLNSLIYNLRKSLRSALMEQPPVLCEDGVYWLNVDAGIYVDVVLFDAHYAEAKRLHRNGDIVGAETELKQAISLYHGDLSETGLVETVIERQRLRDKYLDALRYLAEYALQRSDWDAGLDFGHAMLKVDVCLEEAHRVVMRSYAALGRRTQAIRQFELCCDVLKQELNIDPERETITLDQQIREG
jgi:DNA-binding SARP family transcriptional activator